MSLIKLEEGVYYYPYDDRYLRPNLFYIKGEKKSWAIDGGNTEEHRLDFFQAIEDEGFPLPEKIILTHCHWDHSFGVKGFAGEVISTLESKLRLDNFRKYEWNKKSLLEMTKKGYMSKFSYLFMRKVYREKEIHIPKVDRIYKDRHGEDLGGIHLEIIKTMNPHCEDSFLLWIPERGVLIIGDADYPSYENNVAHYDFKKTMAFCDLVEGIPFEIYCGSHKDPINRKEALVNLMDLRKNARG